MNLFEIMQTRSASAATPRLRTKMFAVPVSIAKVVVFLCLCSFLSLASSNGRIAKTAAPVPRKYFVFGLPFSGVDYLERLLLAAGIPNSTLSVACSTTRDVGGRNTSDIDEMRKWNAWKFEPFGWNDFKEYECSARDETLFIMVTKDPFSWLSSVARRRYNTQNAMRMHMRALVNAKWDDKAFWQHNAVVNFSNTTQGSKKLQKKKTHRRFKTIMSKRTVTMQSHFSFLLKTKHHAIVRYEDLITDFSGTMRSMFRGHGILLGNISFMDVPMAKAIVSDANGLRHQIEIPFDSQTFYREREYLSLFDESMMATVVNGLNQRLERKFGYTFPSAVRKKTRRTAKTILGSVWLYVMNVLWWIVVPTIGVMMIFSVLVAVMKDETLVRASSMLQKKEE